MVEEMTFWSEDAESTGRPEAIGAPGTDGAPMRSGSPFG